MLKVLVLVDHAVGISGPHRNVVGTLNALTARSDLQVRLLCGRIDPNEPYAKSNRLDIHLDFNPHQSRKVLANWRRVKTAVRNCDLIYVPTGLKSFLYAFAGKGHRKLVAGPNVTGIPILMNPANPSPLMTLKMSDAWIEMSEVRVRHCMRAGTPREYIDLVPHAIDTEHFHPRHANRNIWRNEGLQPNRKKIVYVGNMYKELKGIPQLIDAYRLIRDRLDDVDLVMIGKSGKQLTPEHRALRGVHVLGPRYGDELVRLVASADLFMGASRNETFWLAPLEAMACGVPAVVSKVGAVPTMIPQDGVQGRAVVIHQNKKFLPDAAERLAEAALPLLIDDEARKRMGRTARQHAVSEFSERRLGERLVMVFRCALEDGNRG